MKKSRWFNGRKFVPSHPGNYQVTMPGVTNDIWLRYWDGSKWFVLSGKNPFFLANERYPLDWRGLAEDPNKYTQQRKS